MPTQHDLRLGSKGGLLSPAAAAPRGISQLYSAEAEKAVLGCMIAQPNEVVEEVAETLMRHDFFVPAHQEIFTCVCKLHATGEAIDVMMVHQWLADRKLDVAVGSPGLLAELLTGFATHLNIGSYIRIVKDKALLRALYSHATRVIADIAERGESVSTVLDRADDGFQSLKRSFGDRSNAWQTVELDQFIAEQSAAREPVQLVAGFIEQGTKITFAAASKSKKTWTMLDLGLSVAFNKPFWNMTTSRAKVIYLDFELQRKKLANRIAAVAKAKGIATEPGWLYPFSLRGQMANPTAVLKQIRRKALELGVGLIIIDPAYKFIAGKDENAAGDIAAFLNELESVVVETGAAVVIANHFSKGNQSAKDPMDRISGSGVWARDADTLFVMTAHQEEDCLTVSPVLRNFQDLPEFVVRWRFPLMERAVELDPKALKQVRPHNAGEASRNASELLTLLQDKSLRYAELEKTAFDQLGIKEGTFKKYFGILKREKKITFSQGQWGAAK